MAENPGGLFMSRTVRISQIVRVTQFTEIAKKVSAPQMQILSSDPRFDRVALSGRASFLPVARFFSNSTSF